MSPRHPLREPMVWLLIALPAVVVVAGIVMLVVSIRSGGNDAVIDPVARTAQIQTVELGPDERAAALKLSAVLQVDGSRLLLLPASGEWTRNTTVPVAPGNPPRSATIDDLQRERDGTSHDQPLILVLSHPTQASQDLEVELRPTELGWDAQLEQTLDGHHDWRLRLAPADGRWRLQGRLPAGQQAARLGPALKAD